jgi:hypothetical protein
MEDKMEQLVRSLKNAKPALKNPESLTDSIMNQILQKPVHQVSPILLWARAALSTAAVLLLGLFLFQQTEAQEMPFASNTPKPVIEKPAEMDSSCLQMLGSEHLNYIETYLCYMQQNSIENELFKTYPLQKN